MNFVRPFLATAILAVTTLACGLTGSPNNPSSDVLFSDDFSNTDKKWDQVNEPTRSTDYHDGSYRIVINDTNSDAWANPGSQSFTDVSVEMDATKNSGPDDNDFGIICRYSAVDKFYYGVVSSDGYYGILKMTANGGTILGEENLRESNEINMGAASNHVRFDCVGSTLTLYVNGAKVASQSDPEYTEGNIGLIAGTFDTQGTDVLFDNVVVKKP